MTTSARLSPIEATDPDPNEEMISIGRWSEQLGISDKAVLTTHEAAAVLRISERSLRQGIYDGAIPFVRLGRRILIPVPVLLRALLDGDLHQAA